jgi:glycosyltransferase involved in cell wall biosynthesis
MKRSRRKKPLAPEQRTLSPVQAYRLAEAQFLRNDLNACEQLCRAILSVRSDDADAVHLLGVVCAKTGRVDDARQYIERAVAIRPSVAHYRQSLDNLRRQLERINEPVPASRPPAERDGLDYAEWVRRYDTPGEELLHRMRLWSRRQRHAPLVSVLMPTFNSDPQWLRQAVESVLAQAYPHWQLCIADDASSDPRVRELLDAYAAADARIHVRYRRRNGHISAASNSALALAEGELVALLDHDDILAPHALFLVARAATANTEAALIYSDEDKLDREGNRCEPYFKPDWNPDLLLSHNCVSHLGVYRTDLVRELGGFREGFEGAQDHDLALRVSECLQPDQIHHLPHVLYHWRVHDASTAAALSNKSYALDSAVRAVQQHLERRHITASVSDAYNCPGQLRVRYRVPDPAPLASLIIPTFNRLELLRACVGSILDRTRYPRFELLIVDNGSDDPAALDYLDYLRAHGMARVVSYPRPFNYSAMNNLGVREAAGELLVFLNNDVEVLHEGWLEELAAHALRPEVGAVGARLLYPDNRVQHAGVIAGMGGVAGHWHGGLPRKAPGYFGRAQVIQGLTVVTGACMAMRRAVFEASGGFNTEDLAVAFNDVDLCLRIRYRLGLRVIWTPYAELQHRESATRGYEDTPEKQARFNAEIAYMQATWNETLLRDPAYNPNLALDRKDCTLAFPPRVRLRDHLPDVVHLPEEGGRLVFLHIPKTAGTSLRSVVTKVYGKYGVVSLYPPFSEAELEDARRRLASASALIGHLDFGIHRRLDIDARYVTLLRDPVQRVLSLYGHMERNPQTTYYKQIRDGMRVREFLDAFGHQANNHMVRILSGYGGAGFLDDESVLRQALDNLERHFAFIGFTEEFEKSLQALARCLGWSRVPEIPHLNAAPKRAPHTTDEETLEVIRRYNRLDQRLFEWAREKWVPSAL